MHGLVVGRFQPVHDGHVAVVKRALEDSVHATVAIGSAHAPQSPRNPFSLEERAKMLEAAFGDSVKIVPLPDIHDPPRWVDHVQETVGAFDKVYGNDERSLMLFEDAGVPVIRTGLVDRDRLEASTIRMQIAEGDPIWRRSVPKGVVALLEEWDAAKRLRLLEARA